MTDEAIKIPERLEASIISYHLNSQKDSRLPSVIVISGKSWLMAIFVKDELYIMIEPA